jgi:hypothetical protein
MAAELITLPFRPVINTRGVLEPGALLDVFQSGTTTRVSVFSDADLSAPLTNPVVADASGVFPTVYFDNSAAVRVRVRQANGSVLGDADPYFSDGLSATDIVFEGAPLDEAISARPTSATLAASGGAGLVGFIQAGTGAVARTTQAKLRETVSVKDFGAVGDGVTNDTAAIAAAFAAVSANPLVSELVFPSGEYLVVPTVAHASAAIFPITRGFRIIGKGGKIKIAPATPGFFAIIGHPSADLTGLFIEGMEFDHNAPNTNNFTVGNVFGAGVLDQPRQTVWVKRGFDFVFRNNIVRNAACTNSIVYSGDGNTANCLIEGNRFLKIGRTPNRVYHDHSTLYPTGDNIKVLNNYFEGESWGVEGTTCAVEAHPGYGCIISGNSGTKFQSAINYAGVYETDSRNGIVTNNEFECLRHFIIMFGSAYLSHVTGYSIDGLIIEGNRGFIRNSLPLGFMSGGLVGVGGIVFNASLSLPVRDVTVKNNSLVYDVETAQPDYVASYGALGIFETSNNTTYENVIFQGNLVTNPPLQCMVMGQNNGTLKNCAAYDNTFINPCSSFLNNGTTPQFPFFLRRGLSAIPNSFVGSFRMSARFFEADKDLLIRPFVISATNSSTGVQIKVGGEIVWNDNPADFSDYKLVTTFNDNTIPLVQIRVSGGSIQTLGDFAPSFTNVNARLGSFIYKKSTNDAAVWAADGTTLTTFTPASASDAMLLLGAGAAG